MRRREVFAVEVENGNATYDEKTTACDSFLLGAEWDTVYL